MSDYCPLTEYISFSEQDTVPTVIQIEKHNSKRACICENDCPQKTVVK